MFIYCVDGGGSRRHDAAGLSGRRMMMDARIEVALSGAVVVSMAGLARLLHGSLF
jgi:hypothetical protein